MTTQAASPPQANAPAKPEPAEGPGSRQERAYRIAQKNTYLAIGFGLVPIPLVDFVALTVVQIKMLKELSDLYGVSFREDKARTAIGSLVAGTGSLALMGAVAASLVKFVPVVGQVVGVIGVPLIGGALTLAIGRLFVMHYESGGTLLTFDAVKMRGHFQREFEQAKGTVKKMQRTDPQEPIAP